uniref:CCHC-type domain-containing protein n=1 Tax=Elaeophora elaphi TaxID=1147741 RepID=A0A0R3RXK8_9BILA
MLRKFNDDLEEGEIRDDDEEINIKQSNVTKYSGIAISERTNLTTKRFQSSHDVSSESLHSKNLKIPYQSTVKISDDNLKENNYGKEGEKAGDKSKEFHDYEVDEDDGECFLDQRMTDEDQSDEELKDLNFQDELVEYQSNLDDESDGDDNDNSEFSDEIVCSEGIIAANEFHSKMATLSMDAEHKADQNTIADGDKMRTDLAKEVPVDDNWIFQSLDEPSRIVMQGNEAMDLCTLPESEGNLREQLAEMDLTKFEVMIDVTVSGCLNRSGTEAVDASRDEKQVFHEGSSSQTKQIIELEKKFAKEKENYVRNIYSLLVTARAQIAALKKENKKLKMKLQGNYTMNCPECEHQISLRNNSLKPKYVKVLKGRCAIEMSFDNLEKMEEWLAANYLDINPDGLPVLMELPRKPTLASTNSLLAPKTNSVRNTRRKSDKLALTSSYPVAERQNVLSARVVNNVNSESSFKKYSTKQSEKLNRAVRNERTKDRFNARIACSSDDIREKQSHEGKRSGPDTYEEQQRHRIQSMNASSDVSFDRNQRRFISPTSCNFRDSRRNTKRNATKCVTSMSDRKVIDHKDQHTVTDSSRNRFQYRSPSVEYRRHSIRSPVCVGRAEYCRNHSTPDRLRRNMERKLRLG